VGAEQGDGDLHRRYGSIKQVHRKIGEVNISVMKNGLFFC
jgi:hypothetical protein